MLSRLRVVGLVCGLVLLVAGGCGRESKLPTAASTPEALSVSRLQDQSAATRAAETWGGFFPLELGNRWHYVYTYSTQFLPADGSTPEPPIVESTTTERQLVCVESVDGRSFVVERETFKSGRRAFWTLYRQDRAGLYEIVARSGAPPCDATTSPVLDGSARSVAAAEAAWNHKIDGIRGALAREAIRKASPILRSRAERVVAGAGLEQPALARRHRSGPVDDEALLLRYPLHPGARWDIRPPPLLSATVEGVDVITLPNGHRVSAYRIRYTGEAEGANDLVRVWYGRSGYLGLVGHFHYVMSDPGGNPIGTVVGEFSDVLDDIALVAPAPPHGE